MCGLRIWGPEEHVAVDPVVCTDTYKQRLMRSATNYPRNHVYCLNCYLMMLMLILWASFRVQHRLRPGHIEYRDHLSVLDRYEHECHPNRDGPEGASRIGRGWCPHCLSLRQISHFSDLPDAGDEALRPPIPREEVLDIRDNYVLLHCPNNCRELRRRPVTLHRLLDHLTDDGRCRLPASQGGGIVSNNAPMNVVSDMWTTPLFFA